MCGIAGLISPDRRAQRSIVEEMVARLGHRGPDDQHLLEVAGGWLGTARLAIVDRPGGQQPLWEPRRRVAVALNGEVYGHAPLRKELSANGQPFETESDTEVIASLVEATSPERALRRMDGMFAVAIWEAERGRLTLARDRLGQKPLYWTRLPDGALLFGSELKALLAHPEVRREVDPVAVQQLLLFEYIPAPRSIYRGVHKLEAGTLLELDAEGLRIRRWYHPPRAGLEEQRARLDRTAPRMAESVRVALRQAVRLRTDTDLPVAVLLSGGLDSSAVAALAAQRIEDVRSFSVGFDEPSFDESAPARLMAEHIGATHTAIPFRSDMLPEVLDGVTAGLCEPLADGSLPSTWLLAREVHRAGFKLALSGDGADEHFGGYPTYPAHRVAARVPRGGRLMRAVASRMPASTENLSTGYKARRFAAGMGLSLARRNQVWLGGLLPEEVEALVGLDEAAWEPVDRWGAQAQAISDPVEQAMYLDQRLYLAEGVLQKVDRASMAHALEVRSPFLDHRLTELAVGFDTRHKVGPRKTKVLLRRAFADWLPDELLRRPKKGFGTPLGPWLAGPCTALLEELDGLEGVDPARVRQWVDEHRRGLRDHRKRLWTLLILARWQGSEWGPSAPPMRR